MATPDTVEETTSSRPQTAVTSSVPVGKKTWRFWAVFPALCMTTFLSALDTSILSTALPTISEDLNAGPLYIWITNAYILASTVTLPLFGQSANIFGRRWLLILSVVWFAIGSGLAGGAKGTIMIIIGRTIQGVGGGGINSLIDIIIGDLVPMRERGKYVALMGTIWAIGTVIGPVLGGSLAEYTSWRWIFYVNLPLSAASLILLYFFLRVASPPNEGIRKQISRVDFVGNAILVTAVISILLSLTWAGTLYPWSSWRIILPLVLGFIGLLGFYVHQTYFCIEPSIPLRLFPTPTSLFSLILAFVGSILIYWVGYFLPIYFQAVLGTSATKSGLYVLPITGAVAPFGILAGILISAWGKYRAFHFIGFGFMSIGISLFSILDQHSPTGYWVGFQILFGAGSGLIYSSTLPPIQASLSESDMATATATWAFMRSFGSIWGIAIPTAIFNQMIESLLSGISSPSLRGRLSNGGAYALASTGRLLRSLADNPKLLSEVIEIYTKSLRFVWLLAIPFGVLGFIAGLPIRQLELKTQLETEFGLQDGTHNRQNGEGQSSH
ncbi:hypothetical protein FQN49_001290 [Arthroderma sp. PD_2]|nr:hypothetical protein FQN49_001290 [Arthroderma sp. PD_2]